MRRFAPSRNVTAVTARPVAYIRRSARSRSDPGDISRDFQIETVRRLAGADGPTLGVLDGDWGKSAATEETDKRLAFLGLMQAIEQGDVSAVYAYSTDRLARSVRWSAQLLDACERAGTLIVTSEGRFEPGDDLARQMFQFQAITNESYSRQAKKKRAATVATMRARGMKLGQPFYGALPGEALDAVVAAFDRTGSYNGAATSLNALRVPARRGRWAHSSVRAILEREGKAPRTGTRGAKTRAAHVFHRLLICHCGHTLTGSLRAPDRGGRRLTVYRCIRAETIPSDQHGKKSVAEDVITRWAKGEAELYALPDSIVLGDSASRRIALEARLNRANELYIAGDIDREHFDVERGKARADLEAMDDESFVEELGPIDWAQTPPAELNALLRAFWRAIRLDAEMRPIGADWRIARMNQARAD
jgi:DNA invertase Pin-like site-specific DNA recombinase